MMYLFRNCTEYWTNPQVPVHRVMFGLHFHVNWHVWFLCWQVSGYLSMRYVKLIPVFESFSMLFASLQGCRAWWFESLCKAPSLKKLS